MKRSHRLATVGLSLLLVAAGVAIVLSARTAAQPPREEQWKKVNEAVNKGLPKTAIDHLNPIIESAIKDKAYPEAIKAIAKKISLEGNIEGNKPEEKIKRMEAAIATAPAEMQPVMNAILAHWYWHYFQQNRWRFTQRTATGESPGADITTWDLPRIFAEIDKTFDKALAAEKELKATPVEKYDVLLAKGSIPDKYRPTLFDFLAFDALSFYTSAEQAGAKPQDAFELPADSPIFGSVDEFLKWEVKTTDAENKTIKAIAASTRKLLSRSTKMTPTSPPCLDRRPAPAPRFGWNKAVGEKRNANYKAAIRSLRQGQRRARTLRDGPLPTRDRRSGRRRLGQGSRNRPDRDESPSPDSNGGKLCYNLVQQIESKSASTTTERVWADPLPTIKVTYKNITKAYFRVVQADYVERLKGSRWRPEQLDPRRSEGAARQKAGDGVQPRLAAHPGLQAANRDHPRPRRVSSLVSTISS